MCTIGMAALCISTHRTSPCVQRLAATVLCIQSVHVRNCQHAFLRSQSTQNLEKERKFLSEFPGGSVDLTKDNDAGIATILVNYPAIKNGFSGKMMLDLSDAVTDLESWKEGRGVVLRGAGETFCSGGDLRLMKGIMTPEKGGIFSRFMHDALTRFFHLPLVTVAFVEGKALGGGAELSTASDFRAFARSASLGFVQLKLGVTTGWGGGMRLVQLLGRTKALRLLASGTVLSAQEALDIRLADYVVDDGSAGMDQVLSILRRLTSAASPFVLQTAKKIVLNAAADDISDGQKLEGERKIFQTVWGGPAHIKAMEGGKKFAGPKP